jgi:DNA-binding transcriptional LysR family regulator
VDLEDSFANSQMLTGTVRITAAPFLAHRLLIPVLAGFRSRHPKVQVEIEISETLHNLIESNFDLAIRVHSNPEDSGLIYRKLLPNNLVFCASPEYLSRSKALLRTPSDLCKHPLLILNVHDRCRFRNNPHRLGDFTKNSRSIVCDNGWLLTQAALAGLGVHVRSIWDVKGHFESGSLVQVLTKSTLETFGDVYSVVPSRRFLPARVRVFQDMVIEEAANWRKSMSKSDFIE